MRTLARAKLPDSKRERLAPFNRLYANDIDSHAVDTFKLNHPMYLLFESQILSNRGRVRGRGRFSKKGIKGTGQILGHTVKADSGNIWLSATDLANHLACHHLTSLDLAVAVGTRSAPIWHSPDLWVLRERGFAHEKAYLEHLAAQGMSIVDLRDILDDELAIAETFAAPERGVDVIAQATLAKGRWFGWADVLRRVERAGKFGGWSYEVYDCKLARETKAATILQLSLTPNSWRPSREFRQSQCTSYLSERIFGRSDTGYWTSQPTIAT